MLDPKPFPKANLARAGTFLIDAAGSLRATWLLQHYHERPDPAAIFDTARTLK